jgi:hypothetical protein
MTREQVGSLAEEAAKLVSALSSMSSSIASAATSAGGHDNDHEDDQGHVHDPLSPECRYCPICAVGRAARAVTPEVREHLTSAALSLAMALKSFVDEAMSPPSDGAPPVEKIDVAED